MNHSRKIVISGVIYTAISKYSNVLISIIITAVLARILSPEEFGLIAIVMVFISFFQLLSDFGIGPAIIQNKDLTNDDIESIFLFSILIGFFLGFVFYLSAPLLSEFYNKPELKNIAKLLSLAVLFFSLNVVPQSLNYKKFLFKKVSLFSFIIQVITGIIAIIFAYKGYSYYALVIKSICDGLFIFIANYYLSPISFSFKFKYSSIKKIFKFSSFQFLFNFVNYFSRNADNLLIGKYFSSASLGFYDKSYKLMMMPVQNLTNVITPVLQPVLSNFQNDNFKIFNTYLKVVKILALIGFPLSIFLYFSASEIIHIVFGVQWLESIPIFKLLAFTVGIQMILSSSGSIFQAANRTDLLFVSGFLSALIMVGGISYGVFIGKTLISVGYGLIIAFIINFFQAFYILVKVTLRQSFALFLKAIIYPLIIAFCVFVVMTLTSVIIISNDLLSLLFKCSQFFIVFLITSIFKKEYRNQLTSLLIKK